MANKSHFNSGLKSLNRMNREGRKHSSFVNTQKINETYHFLSIYDSIKLLPKIPDNSVQLILIDPPYNLDLDTWDSFENYLDWAKQWVDQIDRILKPEGNCIIFGGFQYQDLKKGDLLEILHYSRHNTKLRFTNLIIWYYKNGMSAHRYFANRHEEFVWLTKTKKYYFDLDSVRAPYDEKSKVLALKDKRLNPVNVEKGKNPTNVWEIGRLNGNSKERVGHPTQKPLEIIRRLVKSLSYPGSIVLDFFAGSGTTGRVCIEEARNSILIDNDPKLNEYFNKHIKTVDTSLHDNKPKIYFDSEIEKIIQFLTNDIQK
jgi:site-specific DNA-methyltransferase (adenine-specific)